MLKMLMMRRMMMLKMLLLCFVCVLKSTGPLNLTLTWMDVHLATPT